MQCIVTFVSHFVLMYSDAAEKAKAEKLHIVTVERTAVRSSKITGSKNASF